MKGCMLLLLLLEMSTTVVEADELILATFTVKNIQEQYETGGRKESFQSAFTSFLTGHSLALLSEYQRH